MQLVGLSEAGIERLRPVLDEERRAWLDQLEWDYRPALDLIARFIGSGTLPGFAVVEADRAVGYSYYVIDRPVAFIGGLYLVDSVASSDVYGILLNRIVHAIRSQAGVDRVESQVFPFNASLDPLFTSLGFEAIPRSFLALTPKQPAADADPSPFRLRPWNQRRAREAAEVIFDSYLGAPDGRLCRDYQSRGGCVRFLRNLVDNPACGLFDASNSLLAEDEGGRLCGVLLASRIRDDIGMVPQLSVRRSAQARGLGRALLASYIAGAPRAGLARLTLSVSETNQRASRLYRAMGFEVTRQFHAFLWER